MRSEVIKVSKKPYQKPRSREIRVSQDKRTIDLTEKDKSELRYEIKSQEEPRRQKIRVNCDMRSRARKNRDGKR